MENFRKHANAFFSVLSVFMHDLLKSSHLKVKHSSVLLEAVQTLHQTFLPSPLLDNLQWLSLVGEPFQVINSCECEYWDNKCTASSGKMLVLIVYSYIPCLSGHVYHLDFKMVQKHINEKKRVRVR